MIRRFKIEDLNKVMEIWLNTNIGSHDFIPASYWKDNFELVKEILPTAEIYVYEEEDIKGFIGVIDGYIAGLFVCKADQSRGIGKQLMDYVKTQYNQLTLNVYAKNKRAFHFYIKQEFNIMSKSVDVNTNEVEISMMWEKEIQNNY